MNMPVIEREYQVKTDDYIDQYQQSLLDNDNFWLDKSKAIDWLTPPTQGFDGSYAPGEVSIKWFADGALNVSANCIDRHLAERASDTAIIWESDAGDEHQHISFQELYDEVKLSNGLKKMGVGKGDRVAIYMPMIHAMLACARIGAVHSVIFGGFSPNAIADRVNDCGSKVVITADAGRRGTKAVPLKANVDEAHPAVLVNSNRGVGI